MANENLSAAKTAKQDEYYTQWAGIEREMNAYLEYDPDVFRGKTVLLPCARPPRRNRRLGRHVDDESVRPHGDGTNSAIGTPAR